MRGIIFGCLGECALIHVSKFHDTVKKISAAHSVFLFCLQGCKNCTVHICIEVQACG